MALTPEEQAEMEALEKEVGPDPQDRLAAMIDPNLDPVPQVLATLPATNHPGGDEGAEASWMRKPGGDSKGIVFAYEPTLDAVKKRYAEDPAFLAAVFPSLPPDPQMIASMTRDSAEYQAAAAKYWQETADAAASNGKTAYRYSYAPYLQGTQEMGALNMLKGAIKPYSEGVTSFVMGLDDTGLLGAGRGVEEAFNPQIPEPGEFAGVETAGGVRAGSAVERNKQVEEEYPKLHAAGQVLGFLNPISLGGKIFSVLGKAGRAAAGAGAAAGSVGGVLAGTAGAALGTGAVVAGQKAVDAASEYARTGSPGTTVGEVAKSAGQAAIDPVSLGLGAGGEVLGALAGRGAGAIAESPRYGANIGRVERMGGKVEYGKGPTAPGTEAAISEGKALDASPVDPVARRIAPEIAKVVKQRGEETRRAIGDVKQKFYPTREGQMRLPPVAMQAETLKELDRTHSPSRGRLRPIGTSKDEARELKTIFNGNVETVTTKPVEGAIELNPDQAEAYLLPMFKGKLVSEVSPRAAPKPVEAQGGAREVDLGPSSADHPNPEMAKKSAAAAYEPGTTVASTGKYSPEEAAQEIGTLGGMNNSVKLGRSLRSASLDFELSKYEGGKDPNSVSTSLEHPIDVVIDSGQVILRDGRHRLAAAQQSGATEISARVRRIRPDGKAEEVGVMNVPLGGSADAATVPPKGKAAKPAGKVAAQPTREADTVKMQEPPEGPGKDEYGQATRPHREAQKADNARAQALAEEMGIPGTEAVEPPQRLADALRKQGISKVYVVPRRYSAENQDALIDRLRTTSREAVSAKQRVAEKLYALALKDRDARPMNGQPGGWSAKQQEHRAMLDAVEAEAQGAGSDPESSFNALVDYAQQRPGQLPRMEAIQGAAQRAGVGDEARLIRMLDPLGQLKSKTGLHKPAHAAPPTTAYGALSAGADALTLRLLYPGLRDLGAPNSPIRGGKAGRAGMVGRDDEKKDKTP